MSLIRGDVNSYTYSLEPLNHALNTQHSLVLENNKLFTLLFYKTCFNQRLNSSKLFIEKSKADKTLTVTLYSKKLETKIDTVLDELRGAMKLLYRYKEESLTVYVQSKSLFAKYLHPALPKLTSTFGLTCKIDETFDEISFILEKMTDNEPCEGEEENTEFSESCSKRRAVESYSPLSGFQEESISNSLFSEIILGILSNQEKIENPLFSSRIIPKSKPRESCLPKSIKAGRDRTPFFDAAALSEMILFYRNNFTLKPHTKAHVGENINLLTRYLVKQIEDLIFHKILPSSQTVGFSETSVFLNDEGYNFPLHRQTYPKYYDVTFLNVNLAIQQTQRINVLYFLKNEQAP